MQGDGRGRRWIRSGIEGLMKVENSLRQAANYVSQLLLGIGIV